MNRLTVAGRLTKDAETRFTSNNTPVTGFTVASDVGFGDKKHAIFVRVSNWRKGNENLAQYLTKGSQVTVVGELDLREYETNGEKRTSLELRMDEIALQGGGQKEQGGGFRDKPQQQAAQPPAAPPPAEPDFADSDIPF